MKELIDKSAIVAEIEKLYKENYKFLPSDIAESVVDFKDDLLMVLDTLEVKEVGVDLGDPKGDKSAKYIINTKTLEVKEVDLEKEIENLIEKEKAFVTDDREVKYYNGDSFNHIYELEFIAKHFYELGLKTKGK